MAKAPKPVRLALGYDSYTVDGETKAKMLTFRFESPPLARAAFRSHLAKARRKKSLAPVDATPAPGGPLALHAERLQLEWDGASVRRAWVTAHETHDRVPLRLASELLALALAQPAFERVAELGIGLQQWQDSHRATFDPILDVLAERRPPLTALALGDYDNQSGHIMKLERAARIAELYPALERLRIACTRLPSLRDAALPSLQSLALRGTTCDRDALAALDRPWPALASLALGWRRAEGEQPGDWAWLVAGDRTPALRHLAITGSTIHGALLGALAGSPLLPRLETLELRELSEEGLIAKVLRERRSAFAHLALVLPDSIRIAGVDDLRITYRRYESSME